MLPAGLALLQNIFQHFASLLIIGSTGGVLVILLTWFRYRVEHNVRSVNIQLGQPSVNPPRLVLEVGGDFNLAGSYACKVEVPPTSSFQVGGDFSSPGMAAC